MEPRVDISLESYIRRSGLPLPSSRSKLRFRLEKMDLAHFEIFLRERAVRVS
jgi:hypothetical protein